MIPILDQTPFRIGWTDRRAPKAAVAAPIGKPEHPERERERVRHCICNAFVWVQMQGICDPERRRMARGSSFLVFGFWFLVFVLPPFLFVSFFVFMQSLENL